MIESSLRPRPINFKPHRMSAKFTSAYCGAYHTFVVHESHKLFAFGLNNHGQLGVGDLDEHDLPELVEGLGNGKIVQVEGGEHHSLVLDDRGAFL